MCVDTSGHVKNESRKKGCFHNLTKARNCHNSEYVTTKGHKSTFFQSVLKRMKGIKNILTLLKDFKK